MGPVFLYPTYMVDIYIPVWDNAGVPAGRAALFRKLLWKNFTPFLLRTTIGHSDVLCFLYKATFTILSRSDIDSFEHVIYQLPNAVQPTLCYTMFSRSLSNDWCTYTCHTQILFSIYEQVAMCYVYYCISNWSSCWTRVHLLLLLRQQEFSFCELPKIIKVGHLLSTMCFRSVEINALRILIELLH